jgi:electron transport complex protein RnfG
MNNNKPLKQIVTLGIILSTYCIVAAIALSVTYSVTLPAIILQEKKATENSMKLVYPSANSFIFIESEEGYPFLEDTEVNPGIIIDSLYQALDENGAILGMIVKGSSQGYGGPINYVFGINPDQTIQMVTIIDQCETPGLGANVCCADFLNQFNDKPISDNFIVKKDIKPITASTITSKALSNGIKETSDFIIENYQEITNEE